MERLANGPAAGAIATFVAFLFVLYGDFFKRPKLIVQFDGAIDIAKQDGPDGGENTRRFRNRRGRLAGN